MAQNKMPQKRKKHRRPKKLEAKYAFRRFMVVLVLLAIIAGTGIYIGYKVGQGQAGVIAPPELAPFSQQPDESDPASSEGIHSARAAPSAISEDDAWKLVLVNMQNPISSSFEPALARVDGDARVDARIRDQLLGMLAAAREDGIILVIVSAYRSYDMQNDNFQKHKDNLVSQGMTSKEAVELTYELIAPPGMSEHQTGLAVDILTRGYMEMDEGFENTPAFKWLSENAEKYGFILRYPRNKNDITGILYEPWHYRYVGVEHAAIMNQLGYCLEEYIDALGRPVVDEGERGPEDAEDDIDEGE